MKVIGIYDAAEGHHRTHSTKGIQAFASSRGLAEPSAWFGLWSDAIQAANFGDVIIVVRLAKCGNKPSEMLANLSDAVSRNIQVFVTELNADAPSLLPVLRTVCASYSDIEARLTKAEANLAKAELFAEKLEISLSVRTAHQVRMAFEGLDIAKFIRKASADSRGMLGTDWRSPPPDHPDLIDGDNHAPR